MALTATTQLEAINTMLSTIGESPINSLEGTAGVVDAVTAQAILKEVSVQVQEEGWHWNTEKDMTLSPDLTAKEITLPANCIQVDTTGASAGIDVVQRGRRLYNKDDHSYQFTNPLTVEMLILLDFEELPQAARHYITIRAARTFQKRTVGSQLLDVFSQDDEVRARASLVRLESGTGDHNMLSGSHSMRRILNRN